MVYEPQEDSYLLLGQVRIVKGDVLEIGTGTGLIAFEAAKKADSVLAVDIDARALSLCQRERARLLSMGDRSANKIRFEKSDLFDDVEGTFDWILFNPPYLPLDEREPRDSQLQTTGGKEGHELIEKFLDSAARYLNPGGKILLLFSTLTGKKKVEQITLTNLFTYEEVDKQNIPFETIYVYLIKKGAILKTLDKKGVSGLQHLTKGHRGMIFVGEQKGKKIAVKVQRGDIGATGTVDNESWQLVKLNKNGIGPKLLFSGTDFFAYEFVDGRFIFDFIEKASRKKILEVFRELLSQMHKMDELKLNKEEMHHPHKHVIVGRSGEVTLLDFERCKPTLKPHNVTQVWQFFASGLMEHALKEKKITFDRAEVMKLSRQYKNALLKGSDAKRHYDALLGFLA